MTLRHLVLCGMMGSGKSTVGAACALELNIAMIDTDELVHAQCALSVSEIFEQFGETEFRRLEAGAVADAANAPEPSVIACGGGVMQDVDNRRVLRSTGFVVWLDASVEMLARRVGNGSGRPLLRNARPIDVLTRLDGVRRPSYDAAADIRIDTSFMNRSETVAAVIEAFTHGVSHER